MTSLTHAIDPSVHDVVLRVLKERMGRYGLNGVHIEPGRDQDGDPVLFIEATYDLSDEPIDPASTFGLVTELRDALAKVGEPRFPHLTNRFHELQSVGPRRKGRAR